jgi:hypothetical protein
VSRLTMTSDMSSTSGWVAAKSWTAPNTENSTASADAVWHAPVRLKLCQRQVKKVLRVVNSSSRVGNDSTRPAFRQTTPAFAL